MRARLHLLFVLQLLLACLPSRANSLGPVFLRAKAAAPLLGFVEWDVRAPSSRAVNIMVVSEAYAPDRLHSFPIDAQRAREILSGLEPIKRHLASVNWYLLIVPSRENGADKPGGPLRDTAFGAYYGDRGVRRLIGHDLDALWRIAQELPEGLGRAFVVLLVNDAEYGGSGGILSVASLHANSGWILAHEFFHSFAGLGDEYSTASGALPFAYPNVALSTNAVPWAGFPGAGLVQIEPGRWKPFKSCLMHSLSTPRLCAWCEHVVERRILAIVGPPAN